MNLGSNQLKVSLSITLSRGHSIGVFTGDAFTLSITKEC